MVYKMHVKHSSSAARAFSDIQAYYVVKVYSKIVIIIGLFISNRIKMQNFCSLITVAAIMSPGAGNKLRYTCHVGEMETIASIQ